MAFFGRYGNLPTVEAARLTLQDIASEITPEFLTRLDNTSLPIPERYQVLQVIKQIEGCQRVIWLNRGVCPVNWLPILFDFKKEHNY